MRRAGRMLVVALLWMGIAGFGRSLYWQGNDKFNKHDYRGAIEAYSKAIAKDPQNFAAWFHRATSHEHLKEYKEALADYDRAIALVPGFAVAYHYRGHVHAAMGGDTLAISDYDLAVATAREAVIDPHGVMIGVDKAAVYYDRGNANRRLGRFEASVTSYDSSIALAPGFAAAYNNRGVSRIALGDSAGGCGDRSRACQLGVAFACDWVRDSCRTR